MGLTEADREMLRAATQRAKDRAARHGASCGVMVFSEGGVMADNSLAATVREAMSSSGLSRYQLSQRTGIAQAVLGRFFAGKRDITLFTASRLFEAIGLTLARVSDNLAQVGETPDGLAELKNDRDKWQTRAVQSEGRVKTLGQELAAMTSDRDGFQQRLVEAEARIGTLTEELAVATADKNTFRADANRARDQLEIARQQLQDRDAADQVPGNKALRQQVTQLIAERERFTQQLQAMEKQAIGLTNAMDDKQRRLDHAEQQRSILLETSQDQLGQIRMAERIICLMADKVAQLAVEGT